MVSISFKVLRPFNSLQVGSTVTVADILAAANHERLDGNDASTTEVLNFLREAGIIEATLTPESLSENSKILLQAISDVNNGERVHLVKLKGNFYRDGIIVYVVDQKEASLQSIVIDSDNQALLRFLTSKHVEIFMNRTEAEVEQVRIKGINAADVEEEKAKWIPSVLHLLHAQLETTCSLSIVDLVSIWDKVAEHMITCPTPPTLLHIKEVFLGLTKELIASDMEAKINDILPPQCKVSIIDYLNDKVNESAESKSGQA